MTKLLAVGIWVATIFVAGMKVKYPELGEGLEDLLTGVMGVGATGLLFTPSVTK